MFVKKIILILVLVLTGLSACIAQETTPVPTATSLPTQIPSPTPFLVEGTDGNPWWTNSVFYEVFVRSFYDSNGDGIGDLPGLIEKLDYLNDGNPDTTSDLGVRGIWLMPIHPSPSYHGYDVTDYYDVNPQYGTKEDFKKLIEEAHRRGIRVLIDLVINHTSVEHAWFIDSKDPTSEKRDWYIWSEEDPGYLGPWNAPAWHSTEGGYYYGVFWSGMPDLNLRNPQVTAQVEDITRFWLEEMDVDGFRIDGAKHLIENGADEQVNTEETRAWFEQFRTFYKQVEPEAFAIGEVRDTIFAAAPYTRGDGLDAVFDFDLAQAVINGVNSQDGERISNAIQFSLTKFELDQFATFLTNHDDPRVMVSFQDNHSKMKAAATVYLTGPGVPFIYYGEEIGMKGIKPDELIRTPMQWAAVEGGGFTSVVPWQPLHRSTPQVNVAAQTDEPGSLLSHYRTLIHLRNELVALRVGEYVPVRSGSGALYAGMRVYGEEVVLTLVNLSDENLSDYGLHANLPGLEGQYAVRGALDDKSYADASFNEGKLDGYRPLEILDAYANLVLIFEKK